MYNPTPFTDGTAELYAPAGLAFGVGSPNLGALDLAIDRLEAAERLARSAEAERVAALAQVDRAARMEAAAELGKRPRARAAEDSLAYRAARAEAATAIHLSEQATAYHLSQAATLSSAYSATLSVLESGEINMRHASVILDAGRVIGPIDLGNEIGLCASTLDPVTLATVTANRAAYESQVLREAIKTTPNRLRPIAQRIAERYALEDLDTRYERARTLRCVWMTMRENGMAEVGALLPAHEATAVTSRLTQMAKRAAQVEARIDREAREDREAHQAQGAPVPPSVPESEEKACLRAPVTPSAPRRTRSEIKADLFADLLLNGTGESATGGPGNGTGISGIVQLVTHEDHLSGPVTGHGFGLGIGPRGGASAGAAGAAEASAGVVGTGAGVAGASAEAAGAVAASGVAGSPEPTHSQVPLPELEGYGPIPIDMARDIAATGGEWNKVTVSLRTGEVLRVDRYRPSERIRRFLAARDQRCRFPGCRVPVHRCDFDHTVDAALGGPTSTTNLGAVCRGHHLLKHHSGWAATQHDNGDYEWTSPTGRTHIDEAISRVTFVRIAESAAESAPESISKPSAQGIAPPKPGELGGRCPF